MRLESAKIRGILSEGMVCSEKELGISESHEGIMVLPSEAPIGMPLSEYLGDTIFDLEVTPNRPDCLCVIGIAREVAALTGQEVRLPKSDYEEEEQSIDALVSVNIASPDLCPRYCASLITGVTISSSPVWLQRRLKSYGMRPINNVVDITNYVMLEHGQPLHAFDYHKLKGQKIIVRRAEKGEVMTTLDEVERALDEDVLVIADEEKPVAIAGIMGGLESEVTDETTAILLESANFTRATIRRGARRFQLNSEASLRFEKGLSRELPLVALKRATRLFQELANGKVVKGVVDAYPGRPEPEGILVSAEEVKRLAGLEAGIDEIVRVLTSLGFECSQNVVASEAKQSHLFFGIDLTSTTAKPSACLALDDELQLIYFGFIATDDDIITIKNLYSPQVIAIDAPLSLPLGLCCLERSCPCQPKSSEKNRKCDRELRHRGIPCYPTTKETFIKELIYRGISLKNKLC